MCDPDRIGAKLRDQRRNLRRIRSPNAAEAQGFIDGTTSLHEFSDKIAAGNLRFKVRTEATGCAAVVLAVRAAYQLQLPLMGGYWWGGQG
jgi:hypothetical protein